MLKSYSIYFTSRDARIGFAQPLQRNVFSICVHIKICMYQAEVNRVFLIRAIIQVLHHMTLSWWARVVKPAEREQNTDVSRYDVNKNMKERV